MYSISLTPYPASISTTLSCIPTRGGSIISDEDGVHSNKNVHRVVSFLVDVVRSFPFIILMVFLMPFTKLIMGTSIGVLAAVVPLTVEATAFIGKLIEGAMKEVDPALIDQVQSNVWLTELRYSNFIEKMPLGFIIFDSNSSIKYVSRHIAMLLEEKTSFDFEEKDFNDLRSFLSTESVAQLRAKESALLESEDAQELFYLEFKRKTLPNFVIPTYLHTFNCFGNINWALILITDLAIIQGDSETNNLVHKINRLEKEVQFDRLTQLYNRFYFEQLVDHELKTHDHENAFIFIDLDNFKLKNDIKGHQYGDHVLRSFSKMLKRSFRGDDFICRMGGDEFCIFARNVDSTVALESHTKRLFEDAVNELDLKFSYGIVLSPKDGNTFDELYNASDAAMYASKKDKKNSRTD